VVKKAKVKAIAKIVVEVEEEGIIRITLLNCLIVGYPSSRFAYSQQKQVSRRHLPRTSILYSTPTQKKCHNLINSR